MIFRETILAILSLLLKILIIITSTTAYGQGKLQKSQFHSHHKIQHNDRNFPYNEYFISSVPINNHYLHFNRLDFRNVQLQRDHTSPHQFKQYYHSSFPTSKFHEIKQTRMDHKNKYINQIPQQMSQLQMFESRQSNNNSSMPTNMSSSSNSSINSTDDANDKTCDGYANFLEDIGIVSYIFGTIASSIGSYTLVWGFVNKGWSFLTTYGLSVPSAILTLLTLPSDSSIVLTNLSTAFGLAGVLNTINTVFNSLPVSVYLNALSAVGEHLSIVSLIIGFGSTFPTVYEDWINFFLDIDPHKYFEGYGCSEDDNIAIGLDLYNSLFS